MDFKVAPALDRDVLVLDLKVDGVGAHLNGLANWRTNGRAICINNRCFGNLFVLLLPRFHYNEIKACRLEAPSALWTRSVCLSLA